MSQKPAPIPAGFGTVTPHLVIRDAAKTIELYQKAFGAEVVLKSMAPNGKIMHAQIRIGASTLMIADEMLEWGSKSPLAIGGTPITMHLYAEDVDAAFKRAVDAGMTVKMPLANMFWGDRYGQVEDPSGHVWALAQHIEDVPAEEWPARMAAAMAGHKPQC